MSPLAQRTLGFILHKIGMHTASTGRPSIRVLDVGCGTGRISLELGKRGHTVTGIDVDPASIDYARRSNPFPQVQFVVAEATSSEAVRKVGRDYDCVLCVNVLEHLAQPEGVLEFAREAMARNGLFILTTGSGWVPGEVLKRVLRSLRLYDAARTVAFRLAYCGKTENGRASSGSLGLFESPHLQFFSYGGLERLFSRAGFVIHETVTTGTLLSMYSFGLLWPQVLHSLDQRLGVVMPARLAGGWCFVLKPDPIHV